LDHEHPAWTALLRQYVHDGEVDYAGLQARGQPELTAYLRSLEAPGPGEYAPFTREQRLAFWMNVYNAYTVRLILDHYPLKSIRRIGWLPVEHSHLRRELKDPRIHFAIVCASRSCPKLRSEAYRASEVDAQLEDAARGFVRDSFRNQVDPARGKAQVSLIFKWYQGDFERDGRTLGEYIAQYAEPAQAEVLRKQGSRVGFLGYDWSLNGR
jgi:hypothetical protein